AFKGRGLPVGTIDISTAVKWIYVDSIYGLGCRCRCLRAIVVIEDGAAHGCRDFFVHGRRAPSAGDRTDHLAVAEHRAPSRQSSQPPVAPLRETSASRVKIAAEFRSVPSHFCGCIRLAQCMRKDPRGGTVH